MFVLCAFLATAFGAAWLIADPQQQQPAAALNFSSPVRARIQLRIASDVDSSRVLARAYPLTDRAASGRASIELDAADVRRFALDTGDEVMIYENASVSHVIIRHDAAAAEEAAARQQIARSDERPRLGDDSDELPVDLRRVAVIMLQLGSHELECSRNEIENLVWDGNERGDSVQTIFEATTYGRITIASDVDGDLAHDIFGPLAIAYDKSAGCDYDGWQVAADEAAAAAHIELSMYQHRIYVLPYFSDVYDACKWRGLGDFGCRGTCHVWSLSCGELLTYVHELGHNFRLAHAGLLRRERGKMVEYGDPTAIMGNKWFGKTWIANFNAAHKDSLGWFRGAHRVADAADGVDARYALAPLDDFIDNVRAPQMLRVRHPLTHNTYYFSFNAHSQDGLRLRTLVQVALNRTTPTLYVGALSASAPTFIDYAHRFAVTQRDVNESALELEVEFGCTPRAPLVHIVAGNASTPTAAALVVNATAATAAAYDALLPATTLRVHVTNRNSRLCLASRVDLVPLEPRLSNVRQHQALLPAAASCVVPWRIDMQQMSATANSSVRLAVTTSYAGDYAPPSTAVYTAHMRRDGACHRRPPLLAVRDADQPTHDVAPTRYMLRVVNVDSMRCAAIDVRRALTVDSEGGGGASLELASSSSSSSSPLLAPQSSLDVTVLVRPPTQRVTVRARNATLSFAPRQCRRGASLPQMTLSPSTVALENRASRALRVTLTSTDADCVPSLWRFLYDEPATARNVHVNVLPRAVRLPSNASVVAYVLVTTPTIVATTSFSTQLRAWDAADHARALAAPFAVNVSVVACERAPLRVAADCRDNYMLDTSAVTSIRCTLTLVNDDSWPCVKRRVSVRLANLTTADGWNTTKATMERTGSHRRPSAGGALSFDLAAAGGDATVAVVIAVPAAASADSYTAHVLYPAFAVADSYNATTRDVALPSAIRLGRCAPRSPSLTLLDSGPYHERPLRLGEDGLLRFVVINNDGDYCPARRSFHVMLMVGLDTVAPSVKGFGGSLPGAYVASRGANETVGWQFEALHEGSYNLTFIAVSLPNISVNSVERPHASLLVSGHCVLTRPLLRVESPFDAAGRFDPVANSTRPRVRYDAGRGRALNYTLWLTNRDKGPACANDTRFFFGVGFSALPSENDYYDYNGALRARGWSYIAPMSLVVPPSETRAAYVSVRVDDDAAARRYALIMLTADNRNRLHAAEATTTLDIECPAPAAVTALRTSQYTPRFKLQRSVRLEWDDPCNDAYACCCPCDFIVLRNGSQLLRAPNNATLHNALTTNFTDTAVRTGDVHVYSVLVVDRRGVRSDSVATCGAAVTVVVGAPDLTSFAVFFSVVLGAALVAAVFYGLLHRHLVKRKRKVYEERLLAAFNRQAGRP